MQYAVLYLYLIVCLFNWFTENALTILLILIGNVNLFGI